VSKKTGGKSGRATRRIRRNRRAVAKHSATLTLLGVAFAAFPLVWVSNSTYGYGGSSALSLGLAGNWAGALSVLGIFLTTQWQTLLVAAIPLFLIAVLIKKFGSRLKLSRHWTV
jgi:hypothetical protein